MSRFRPPFVPNWVKDTLVVIIGALVRLVIIAYVLGTIWLLVTGGFEV